MLGIIKIGIDGVAAYGASFVSVKWAFVIRKRSRYMHH